MSKSGTSSSVIFLSTPSARRATVDALRFACGYMISIHALREEGDPMSSWASITCGEFLSTPSARRATRFHLCTQIPSLYFYPRPPRGGRPLFSGHVSYLLNFYPRPPRGGRPAHLDRAQAGKNFYPRPPRGGRPARRGRMVGGSIFLSTPSARRATAAFFSVSGIENDFYPRPPRGGRPWGGVCCPCASIFLSTPSARRATVSCRLPRGSSLNFYPRPPRGGRRRRAPQRYPGLYISIHALREEGDRMHRG